jgi:UDP-N-acetylglucosamine transferase subunit ALG13
VILVTVGTAAPFDKLIRKVDQLVSEGAITEPVLCQIGHGTYEPPHCKSFRFRPSLDDLFASADLVITHGGATVVALLMMRKAFVAVPNDIVADQHQLHFLERLSKQTPFYWTEHLSKLESLINAARTTPLKFEAIASLADDLKEYIRSHVPARHR